MVTIGQSAYNAILLFVYNALVVHEPYLGKLHPDEDLTIREMVPKHGYPFEQHHLTTQDGYILTIFRIPHGLSNRTSTMDGKRQPVIIMHGFLSNAQDFVLLGPNRSMAYLLADAGYDVWLGNCRGNRWSRRHVSLRANSPVFWRFSWHEIGMFDIPATIDYVLRYTGFPDLFYVGHSQGTTTLFVMASERPEYIRKIKLFAAVAPVCYSHTMPAILAEFTAAFYHQIEWVSSTLGFYELFPHSAILVKVLKYLASPTSRFFGLSSSFIYANVGMSNDTDPMIFPLILDSGPAGCSVRQLLHFIQNKRADKFQQFDYGFLRNMAIYHQPRPPLYKTNTTLPVALIYSDNDWLSTEDDVRRLSESLQNLKFKYKLPKQFNHLDYIFGREAPLIVTREILRIFQKTESDSNEIT